MTVAVLSAINYIYTLHASDATQESSSDAASNAERHRPSPNASIMFDHSSYASKAAARYHACSATNMWRK